VTARAGRIVLLGLLAVAALAAPALAETQSVYHGGTYIGSVIVEPGQLVQGNLTVIAGDATIEGIVDGDVDVIGGNLYERPGGTITGQVNTIGGDLANTVVPWSAPPETGATVEDYRVFWHIAWDVVAVLFFLIFPVRARIALDRLEHHPGLCAAVGLLGWVAVLPLAVLLLCTIVLIPFIAIEAALVIAAIFLGKATLALLVGRRLCEVISPASTPATFLALIVGLVLITAAELMPVVGGIVTLFVALIGLGSTILAFVKEAAIAPAVSVPRPPLSGPPMPVA
jgi:hypothetical protein